MKGEPTIPAHWRIALNPAHYCGKAFISSYCQEIFVAVVSNFNTVITFLFDKKYSQRSRNSLPILHFCFRHLLACVKQLFLLSNYYTGGVLQIPSDGDDPWKLKSTPKKNEYFEYLNKVSAKKRLVPKKISKRKISNQEKKRNSIIPVTWKNWPEYHPP